MSLSIRYRICPRLSGARALAPAQPASAARAVLQRRIHTIPNDGRTSWIARDHLLSSFNHLSRHSPIISSTNHIRSTPLTARTFSTRPALYQSQEKPQDVRDPPREESQASGASKEDAKNASSEESQGTENGKGEEGKSQKKKEAPPPPPPHGDKTPWQVFTDTLRTEFKASKEWNESTKALSSTANQFTESESVKKARAAYSAATDAASSTTSSALKSTGKVIGQGAAWTWDTTVVKGVRKGASTVGQGLDKATKPVRDTAAFKSVKEVIDDGSSSRYGGWIEKEERRKARELRELNEAKDGKRKIEKLEEDPKYVLLSLVLEHSH